jgi:hypothetical protein
MLWQIGSQDESEIRRREHVPEKVDPNSFLWELAKHGSSISEDPQVET